MNTERVLIGMGDLVNFNADKFGGRGGWRRNSIREFRVKNFEKFGMSVEGVMKLMIREF